MVGDITYLDNPASLYVKKSNSVDLGNCGDYDFYNHKTTVIVSPNDYETLRKNVPNLAEKIRTKREIAVMKEVFDAKGDTFEEKADSVLNEWETIGENPYINETIVKSNKRYKIRHHQRMIHR